MDFSKSSKIVYQRIQELDPENVSKIMLFLLLDKNSERDMIRLACSPDEMIRSVVDNVKLHHGLLHPRPAGQRSQRLPEFCPNDSPLLSGRICESYKQGYCEHGANCGFLHVLDMKNGHVMILNRDAPTGEVDISRRNCLARLEREIIEILRCRRGIPVPTSCLPILYGQQYSRMLDVEAYLDEGQRGAGCDLTQLVSQMSEAILLVERPHGMQSMNLAEDEPVYMRLLDRIRNCDLSSCQIYLTFTSDNSTFANQDVHNYFSNFGPVQDVRIPLQEIRMYGFVRFHYPETVILVLSIPDHHVIAGAEIMVKPYQRR